VIGKIKLLINNKTLKLIVSLFVIFAIASIGFLWYVFQPEEGKKYLFPEGYRGWVCITYDKPGTPALKIEGDALVLKVPKNGVIETSSRSTIVDAKGTHVFTYSKYYYYSEKGRREAPEIAMGGGFNQMGADTDLYTSYFWISTKENIKSDYEKYVKDMNTLGILADPVCGSWIDLKNGSK